MQKHRIIRGFILSLAIAGLASAAFADIKAFNAAVKAGDYKTASVEAKGVWAAWDRSDPDTAVVAREFGFASYVAGDFAAARDFGQFLKDNGAKLPTPDDQPETSRVLLTAANFKLKADSGTRGSLNDALKAREAVDGLDSITLLAAEALYRFDWGSGKWADARNSAALASRLIARGGEPLVPRALEARASGAAAGFLAGRDKDDYDALADTHDAIVDAIDQATDPKRRDTLVSLMFNVEAWTQSVSNYFTSSDQIGSNIPKNVRERSLKQPKYSPFLSDIPSLEMNACPSVIDAKAFDYPDSALFRGMVGTVIMKFDSDKDGKITKAEVLASVPAAHFADAIKKSTSSMRFVRRKGIPADCSLAQQNRVVTFSFTIG